MKLLSKIAIISPEKAPYSATFIQSHIDRLNAEVTHLYGVFFPKDSADGRYRLRENKWVGKVFHKAKLHQTYKGLFKNPGLTRYLQEEKIQLVLAEFGVVGAEVYDVCEALNIPLIVHFHGYDAYNHSIFRNHLKKYRAMFDYAHYLVVVSTHMQQQLLDHGAPAEKLVLSPCGPNEAFYSVQPSFEEPTFIAVGRFVEKKAPLNTLRAFQQVVQRIPAARLIMVGDGRLLGQSKELVRELRIEHVVVFKGVASHEQVVELFGQAFCFIQHSVTAPNGDSEGTPVAVLEAGAAGLPVVATRHAGIRDVILEGETGYLVDEGDVDGMAAHMIALARDPAKARQLGQKNRERIREHYTMDRHISILNELISKAVRI